MAGSNKNVKDSKNLDDVLFKPPSNEDINNALNNDQFVNETSLLAYKCERCGYEYHKNFDFAPFLCYRCMRYLAKGVFKLYNTIQPPVSRPMIGDV